MGEGLVTYLSSLDVNWHYAAIATGLSLALFAVSMAVVVMALIRLPPRYFHSSYRRRFMEDYPPIVRWSGIVIKNVLGVVLVLLGIAMAVPGVPGQGLLTIFVGILLLDVPGKRTVERRILRQRIIRRSVNRLRKKFSKPPLILD
jgi:hypothetical protein